MGAEWNVPPRRVCPAGFEGVFRDPTTSAGRDGAKFTSTTPRFNPDLPCAFSLGAISTRHFFCSARGGRAAVAELPAKTEARGYFRRLTRLPTERVPSMRRLAASAFCLLLPMAVIRPGGDGDALTARVDELLAAAWKIGRAHV